MSKQKYMSLSGILVKHNFNKEQLQKVNTYLSALLAEFSLVRDSSLDEGSYNVSNAMYPKIESRLTYAILKALGWTNEIKVVYGESMLSHRGLSQYGISFLVWKEGKAYNLVISQVNVAAGMVVIEESSYSDKETLSDQMQKRAYELNLIKG